MIHVISSLSFTMQSVRQHPQPTRLTACTNNNEYILWSETQNWANGYLCGVQIVHSMTSKTYVLDSGPNNWTALLLTALHQANIKPYFV